MFLSTVEKPLLKKPFSPEILSSFLGRAVLSWYIKALLACRKLLALAPVTPGDAAGDAAAAAAPAASAPDGSTGGATTHPRDDEATSPNKGPLKKPSVVQHSDSDTTKQQLTFPDEAAAAAPAAAAAAAE